MKWFRSAAVAIGAFAAVVAVRADLDPWVQNIAANSPVERAFFKRVASGTLFVPARRPPEETRPELTKLIATAPGSAHLYSLRALEAEQQLDFRAAESDWKQYAQLAADKAAAHIALADFYHRRLEPAKEIAALNDAAAAQQEPSNLFERAIAVAADHLLGFDASRAEFTAWIARMPKDPAPYARYFDYALAQKQFEEADRIAQQYREQFPDDAVFPVRAQAQIAAARGSQQSALSIYDQAFQPLWPVEAIKAYFEVLSKTGSLRRYLADARAKANTLNGTARIFYYWQQQGNLANAQRALIAFEAHTAKPDAEAWWTLAKLYEAANNPDRAAHAYYAMYSMQGAAPADVERSLAGIIETLFTYAGQYVQLGSGDLSYYRDIAQSDPYPGYLNGILSLILNTTEPRFQYNAENEQAQAYFHRARAAEMLAIFDARFPASARRSALHAKLLDAYATHGDNAAVVSQGKDFRNRFPDAPQRTEVALLMADAYARTNQTPAEFALYDELLLELGKRAGGVPLGERAGLPAPNRVPGEPVSDQPPKAQAAQPRSPEYARILDRYIARLVSLKRVPAAVALYRREIDRNANDPGLYERFAAFLEQNRLGAEVEAAYRRAMAQFPGKDWSHKLARWYLRQKQSSRLAALTREVTQTFSGAELESYFSAAVPRGSLAASLYLQLNLFAHRRFPHNLAFTRNLLTAYQTRGTANPVAYESLLRANWFNASDLRVRFFEQLARTRKLDAELASLGAIASPRQANANPVAARMLADGQAWRGHFEESAPVYRALAVSYPASPETAGRAVSVYRSLATVDPRNTEVAASIEQNLITHDPGNTAALASSGDIYADRERFDQARPIWNRIAAVAPGRADGYLESATVFWDYFLFDDALRVLGEGRRRLNSPALFAYEAGAIYENKRDYARALNEYATAALLQSNDAGQRRLVRLARRPALRDDIERLTATLASAPDAKPGAIKLRAAILENQGRRPELETFLISAAKRSDSAEAIDTIETQGRVSGFATVQEAAIARRIAITTDPVDQIRYRLALAHFYEDQSRPADAQRTFAALYAEHPTIIGVVRATTDYYWRVNQPQRAVRTLIDAADRAQPVYAKPFRLEASRKATESGDVATARQALNSLLKDAPFQSEYLTAMADTYARSGDDAGLRAFYQSTIQALRGSDLSAPDKTERAAAMRRGLIPVLTRVRDYNAALDQYIEILNRYPEDEQLARESASYAAAHALGPALIASYTKATAASPRDYRWPMVLARIDTELERFPEAIDAYTQALAIRPDRVELWTAQARLDERLLRFAAAEQNYTRLYELTFRNPAWMECVATVRARQGNKAGAIAALRTAYIENRPEHAEKYMSVASRLVGWGYAAEARQFAEKGAELAGPELTAADSGDLAGTYARVMGQARQYETAYRRLTANGIDVEKAPGLPPALRALGSVVKEFYTPEEKAAFAAFFERQRVAGAEAGLDAVESAGLEDITVRWLAALLLRAPTDAALQNRLEEHQRRRIRFSELGAQLEQAWKATPLETENRDAVLNRAADAYHQAGDRAAELRILRTTAQESPRLCALLIQQRPALLTIAGSANTAETLRDLAANCAMEMGAGSDALAAVAARGKGLPPVWTSAYTGLTGLYFGLTGPQVRTAFLETLGSPVIGDRLGKPTNRDRQLAGEPWFYYAARYGEYEARDYLPAMVEATPGNGNAYFELAESYRALGDAPHALVEYSHALELDPLRGAAHDWMAELLWASGKRDEAAAEWGLALETLNTLQDRGPAPPSFTADVKSVLQHAGEHGLLSKVRSRADLLLKTYLRRNGTYRFEALLEGILAASKNPQEGVAWLVELSRFAADPEGVLALAVRTESLPDAQRDAVYQKLIALNEAKLANSFGVPRESAEASLRSWQVEWLKSLVERNQAQRARALLDTIPEAARKARVNELLPLEFQIEAQSGGVQTLLTRYSESLEPLRNSANELRRTGYDAAARRVSKFIYTRELEAHHFDAANFLGLAEIRLEENQVPAAVELLRRMTMLSGEPFENLMPAAVLLERFGRTAEAASFYEQRGKATPWDEAARKKPDELPAVVASSQAPYSVRTAAALALRRAGGRALKAGSAELDLIASSGPLTEAAVNRPYWYPARIEAARTLKEPAAAIRVLRAAIAVDPQSPEARIQLFKTTLDQKLYALAISAVPLEDGRGDLQNSGFRLEDRVEVARGLGEAFQNTGDLPHAAEFYRLAFTLSPAHRAEIEPRLHAVQAVLALREENAQRRPVVSKNIEQPRTVHTRLTKPARGIER